MVGRLAAFAMHAGELQSIFPQASRCHVVPLVQTKKYATGTSRNIFRSVERIHPSSLTDQQRGPVIAPVAYGWIGGLPLSLAGFVGGEEVGPEGGGARGGLRWLAGGVGS